MHKIINARKWKQKPITNSKNTYTSIEQVKKPFLYSLSQYTLMLFIEAETRTELKKKQQKVAHMMNCKNTDRIKCIESNVTAQTSCTIRNAFKFNSIYK